MRPYDEIIDKTLKALNNGISPEIGFTDKRYRDNVNKIIGTIKSAVGELKLSGLPTNQKEQMEAQLKQAAIEDLKEVNADEKARVAATFARLEKEYNRDKEVNRDRYAHEANDYERRVQAMDLYELQQESIGVLSGSKRLRPEALDILSVALKQADLNEHKSFREAIRKQDLATPWRNIGEGKDLAQYEASLDAAIKHGGELTLLQDGHPFNATLGNVLQMEGV
jgi:hypothetical protein